MKVLYYSNRKCNGMYWDASNPEKEAAAFLALFNYLKDYWEVYESLEDDLQDAQNSIKATSTKLSAISDSAEYSAKKYDLEELHTWVTRYERDIRIIGNQLQLFKEACAGNAKSAFNLLKLRKGDDYEDWDFVTVIDPLIPVDKE